MPPRPLLEEKAAAHPKGWRRQWRVWKRRTAGHHDGGKAVTFGGQSAGQKPSGKAGQRKHGEKQNKQGRKSNQILGSAARIQGPK
jgi:hypothetical protein